MLTGTTYGTTAGQRMGQQRDNSGTKKNQGTKEPKKKFNALGVRKRTSEVILQNQQIP